MRRILIVSLHLLVLGALPAWASTQFTCAPRGAHYLPGQSEPVCTLDAATDTVTCTGTTLEQVGRASATVTLTLTACATVLCHDPQNAAIVTSQSTVVTESASTALRADKQKRLLVPVLGDTITPQDVAARFTCPTPTWREEVTDVRVTAYTYTLRVAGFPCDAITIVGP